MTKHRPASARRGAAEVSGCGGCEARRGDLQPGKVRHRARSGLPCAAPAWPGPGTVNLPAELLDLTETGIAYTASIEVPETGADFWDMLATALPRDEEE